MGFWLRAADPGAVESASTARRAVRRRRRRRRRRREGAAAGDGAARAARQGPARVCQWATVPAHAVQLRAQLCPPPTPCACRHPAAQGYGQQVELRAAKQAGDKFYRELQRKDSLTMNMNKLRPYDPKAVLTMAGSYTPVDSTKHVLQAPILAEGGRFLHRGAFSRRSWTGVGSSSVAMPPGTADLNWLKCVRAKPPWAQGCASHPQISWRGRVACAPWSAPKSAGCAWTAPFTRRCTLRPQCGPARHAHAAAPAVHRHRRPAGALHLLGPPRGPGQQVCVPRCGGLCHRGPS